MALLVAAGLFTRSLTNECGSRPRADHVITFGVSPGLSGYTPERALFEWIGNRPWCVPGRDECDVSKGAAARRQPGNRVRVEGQAGPDTDSGSRFNEVGPGYVQTLGMTVLAGRELRPHAHDPKVAIVNGVREKFNLDRTLWAGTWR